MVFRNREKASDRHCCDEEGGEAGGVVVGVDCPVRGEAFILSPRGQGTNRRQVHRASQKEVDLVAVATLIKGSYLRKVWGKHMGLCKDVLCCVVYKSKREKGNNPDVSQLGKETMVWPHNGIAWSHRNDDVAMSGIGNVGKTLTTCCRLKEKKNEPNDAESDPFFFVETKTKKQNKHIRNKLLVCKQEKSGREHTRMFTVGVSGYGVFHDSNFFSLSLFF